MPRLSIQTTVLHETVVNVPLGEVGTISFVLSGVHTDISIDDAKRHAINKVSSMNYWEADDSIDIYKRNNSMTDVRVATVPMPDELRRVLTGRTEDKEKIANVLNYLWNKYEERP